MVSQKVIRETIESYFVANNKLDVEGFVNAFAREARIYYAGEVSPVTGQEAVRQVAEFSITPYSALQAQIERILYSVDGAAVSYTVSLTTKSGRSATTQGIDVFEVNTEGKIQSIRYYIDPEPIMPLFQDEADR